MKQYTVIGLGRFGKSVARGLYELGNEVIVIDIDEENVNALGDNLTSALIGDSTQVDILKAAGVTEVDVVIIGVTDFKTSVMTAALCEELGAKKIIAKARDEVHQQILTKVGVEKAIIPEKESGKKLAHNLVYGNAIEMLHLDSDYEIVEIIVPEKWIGKTLIQLDVRNKYGLTILGINRDQKFIGNPDASTDFKTGDTVLIMGEMEAVNMFTS
ncbi:potassium channel family protein [Helcococcus massiliensis]|uniref:potassium channel family protein n=1 Tax=Helcococcus massiliensis TaxID=2040290 RepID=UPI000CDF06A3|nr:TrkA family potassium uptake protein [Helcococcus massiliensis]